MYKILKKSDSIWPSVFNKIFKAYMLILLGGWIIGNFILFTILSYAWLKSLSPLLYILLFVVGGNIVMFIINMVSMIKSDV